MTQDRFPGRVGAGQPGTDDSRVDAPHPLSIELDGVHFRYPGGSFALHVDKLRIDAAESVACIGPSGSGKTTLLHLMAGILVPERGTIRLGGEEIVSDPEVERRRRRIRSIGLIFQEFELLEYLSVRENILLPYLINPALHLDPETDRRAIELAGRAGLEKCLDRLPARLSHGERQRTAICRALLPRPSLLLADEPTGNLDPRTTQEIMEILFTENLGGTATLVFVTHDHALLERFDRTIDLAGLLREPAT